MSKKKLTGEAFEALTAEEKERIVKELDDLTPAQVRAMPKLTKKQVRKLLQPPKGGRPKFGKSGTKIISATVEKDLLKQTDRYAKAHGMKRSEVIVEGLRLVLTRSA